MGRARGHRPYNTIETMKYDPSKHHRRSIRLKGYDYSQAGAYFVTICINQGLHTLGEISNSQIYPSQPGAMVQSVWDELSLHYPGVGVDAFVLMPDHIHGIILLNNNNTLGATTGRLPLPIGDRSDKPMRLGDVVHRFKSLTTAKYRQGVTNLGWTPFPKRFWQRNYYESIIRDQASLDKIREYILNNPLTWESDPLHLEKYHPQPDM